MPVKSLFLLLVMLSISWPLLAQQDTVDEIEPEVQAQESEPEQITLPDDQPAPFQEFDPSEEISEDFSVPFPVDI